MVLLNTYRLTIFLGATLLFLVQPMFAKMALPLLGGTPAVWNTCMLFFQALLLAGYAYAHATTRLGVKRQAVLHVVILAVVLALPTIAIPDDWQPPGEGTPIFWLLGLLAVAVGGPFFAVSATSPLLQNWFAKTGHERASDPYFLYVASNVGSMLALVGYPFLIERALPLGQQALGWRIGYAVFVALMCACAMLLWRSHKEEDEPVQEETTSESEETSASDKAKPWRWVALAFVASSWLLGVTTFLTTDLAPMPLLWIIPLAIYLLTFIIAFAAKPLIPHSWMTRIFPFAMMVLVASLIFQGVWQAMLLHLVVFFIGAMTCHGELAASRPQASRLTTFYLWISLGGVLGGIFNGLIAPLAFRWILEYPLTLGLACWLCVTVRSANDEPQEVQQQNACRRRSKK